MAPAHKVVVAQADGELLEISFVAEPATVGVDDDGVRTEQLADARLAELDVVFGILLRDVKAQEHREIVLDRAAGGADLSRHREMVTAHALRELRAPSR